MDGEITIKIGTAQVLFRTRQAFYDFILTHGRRRKDGTIIVLHGWGDYHTLTPEDVAKIPPEITNRINKHININFTYQKITEL